MRRSKVDGGITAKKKAESSSKSRNSNIKAKKKKIDSGDQSPSSSFSMVSKARSSPGSHSSSSSYQNYFESGNPAAGSYMNRILSVENRSVNFDALNVEEVTMLQLGKAWLENAPTAPKRALREFPTEKNLPPPLGPEVIMPEHLTKPNRREVEKQEILQTATSIPHEILLACHISYFRKARKRLHTVRAARFNRYKERLRAINLAIPDHE